MIIDTSAIVTILAQEPEASAFAEAISQARHCHMSAASLVELSIVLESQFEAAVMRQCEALLRRMGMVFEPVTLEQAEIARQAFHDYGKGRHPAGLNFGDCFTYALAKAMREPLLFKGGDFGRTDLVAAVPAVIRRS